jgi:hypothetical protein
MKRFMRKKGEKGKDKVIIADLTYFEVADALHFACYRTKVTKAKGLGRKLETKVIDPQLPPPAASWSQKVR